MSWDPVQDGLGSFGMPEVEIILMVYGIKYLLGLWREYIVKIDKCRIWQFLFLVCFESESDSSFFYSDWRCFESELDSSFFYSDWRSLFRTRRVLWSI